MNKNIFVSVDDTCAQRDGKGLYSIHVSQQSIRDITTDQLSDLTDAIMGVLYVQTNDGEEE